MYSYMTSLGVARIIFFTFTFYLPVTNPIVYDNHPMNSAMHYNILHSLQTVEQAVCYLPAYHGKQL